MVASAPRMCALLASRQEPRHNLTLSVPREVLVAARHLAADRGTTLSALFGDLIHEASTGSGTKEDARRWILERLDHPSDLGTGGRVDVTRDELHARP